MVSGARGEKQGPFHGKLTRFIQRINNKLSDKGWDLCLAFPVRNLSRSGLTNFAQY